MRTLVSPEVLRIGQKLFSLQEILSMLSQSFQVQDPEQLLQEVDLNRLKAVIYRDIVSVRQNGCGCSNEKCVKNFFAGRNETGAVFGVGRGLFFVRFNGIEIQRYFRTAAVSVPIFCH